MSRTIIVSLIGGQTIPNVLFIKEYPKADFYLFISTTEMEEKKLVEHTVNACDISDDGYSTIIVDEYNLKNFNQTLESTFTIKSNDNFIVNITGGTKIMSLGAYSFFLKLKNTIIYYLDGGRNQYRQILPEIDKNIISHNVGIDLSTYLKANGVKEGAGKNYEKELILKKNKTFRDFDQASKLFSIFVQHPDHPIVSAINFIHENGLREKQLKLDEYPKFQNHFAELVRFGFDITNKGKGQLSTKETKYLTGEWFEEYVFFIIKRLFGFRGEEIALGIHAYRGGGPPNEFDILFTYKNSLYFIECKTSLQKNGQINNPLYNETLYKAAALKKDFGLYVNAFLCGTDDFTGLNEKQIQRASLLGIKLIGSDVLTNIDKLKSVFNLK